MSGDAPVTAPAPVPLAGAADRRMLEVLVCPMTRGALVYDAARQELVSRNAGLAFPIRNGVPVMLLEEARRLED